MLLKILLPCLQSKLRKVAPGARDDVAFAKNVSLH